MLDILFVFYTKYKAHNITNDYSFDSIVFFNACILRVSILEEIPTKIKNN